MERREKGLKKVSIQKKQILILIGLVIFQGLLYLMILKASGTLQSAVPTVLINTTGLQEVMVGGKMNNLRKKLRLLLRSSCPGKNLM